MPLNIEEIMEMMYKDAVRDLYADRTFTNLRDMKYPEEGDTVTFKIRQKAPNDYPKDMIVDGTVSPIPKEIEA